MSRPIMTLAARLRKATGYAALAEFHRDLAETAVLDRAKQAHGRVFDNAVVLLLDLLASDEGQAALKEAEDLAIFAEYSDALVERRGGARPQDLTRVMRLLGATGGAA